MNEVISSLINTMKKRPHFKQSYSVLFPLLKYLYYIITHYVNYNEYLKSIANRFNRIKYDFQFR